MILWAYPALIRLADFANALFADHDAMTTGSPGKYAADFSDRLGHIPWIIGTIR
jgi:hypothetical protein